MKDPYETQVSFTNQEKCKHGYIKPSCNDCFDPYEAQGKNFRVHHPVQPKTQVERWKEEIEENLKVIRLCGCKVVSVNNFGFYTYNCKKEGTDNCNKRDSKVLQLTRLINEATQPIHPRYPTGTFADDIENAPEYIKKSLFGYNFKKVTLLDKIKKLLWD